MCCVRERKTTLPKPASSARQLIRDYFRPSQHESWHHVQDLWEYILLRILNLGLETGSSVSAIGQTCLFFLTSGSDSVVAVPELSCQLHTLSFWYIGRQHWFLDASLTLSRSALAELSVTLILCPLSCRTELLISVSSADLTLKALAAVLAVYFDNGQVERQMSYSKLHGIS